jgi:hypothetical protein
MTTKQTSELSRLQPDDPVDQPHGLVLVATGVRSLADLEGERIPAEDVYPNGEPIGEVRRLETIIDPLVEERDVVQAPLSKAADTAHVSARKK